MTCSHRFWPGLIALPLLAACASPIPPTYTKADVASFEATYTMISISPNSFTLPGSGSATYAGQIGGGISGGGSLLGDVALTADFGGSSISGRVDNINILGVNNVQNQTLGGHVNVAGAITGTAFSATGTGTLSGVAYGFRKEADATVTLNGQFEDFLSFSDAISGTASISVPDMDVTGGGLNFYAR